MLPPPHSSFTDQRALLEQRKVAPSLSYADLPRPLRSAYDDIPGPNELDRMLSDTFGLEKKIALLKKERDWAHSVANEIEELRPSETPKSPRTPPKQR